MLTGTYGKVQKNLTPIWHRSQSSAKAVHLLAREANEIEVPKNQDLTLR